MTDATPTKARTGHPLNTEATGRVVGGHGQTFRGGGAGDRSIGDAGADFIVGGGNGNTTNLGTSSTDRGNPTDLDGGAGDDRIIGQGSDDTMNGGDDGMQGDRGNHGGTGNDGATTTDRGNSSSLDGGAGDRHELYQFSVGDGHDTFEGGAGGNGVFLYRGADTDVAFTLSPGTTLERVHEGWRLNGEGNGMLTLPDGSTLTFTGVSYIAIRGPETFATRD